MSLSETSMTFTYNGIRSPTLCDKIYDAQSLSCYNSFNLHRVKNWEAWPAGLVHCARCHIFPLEICQQNDSCLPWEDCGAAVCSHVNSCLERCSVSGYGFDSFALFGGVGVLIFGFAALYIRWLGRILVETGLRFWAIMKLHFSHWIVACDVRVLDCKSMHRVAQQPWDMVGLTLSWIFYCLPDSAWTGGNQIGQTKGRRQTLVPLSLSDQSGGLSSVNVRKCGQRRASCCCYCRTLSEQTRPWAVLLWVRDNLARGKETATKIHENLAILSSELAL